MGQELAELRFAVLSVAAPPTAPEPPQQTWTRVHRGLRASSDRLANGV